ncbi:MAG: hypothetical protein DCC58_00755 [Chloroflexi bacterium]|nr:MAG: hypothetical protein DCC58_00755 [Chloroflexota bacterium]
MQWRLWSALVVLCVVSITVFACGGADADDENEGPSALTSEADVTVDVVLRDTMSFEPASITVAPGDVVHVNLDNRGALPHNFSITSLNVDVDVPPGGTATVTFTAPSSPGEHRIVCAVPGHEGAGMVGALVVER